MSPPAHAYVIHFGGRFVDPSEAKVDVLDRGFLLGDGVFATMRGYDGACFRPEQHLASMARGAETLGIALPASLPAIAEIADEAARRTRVPNAYVRVTISRGSFVVIARPLETPSDDDYARGIETIVVGPRRIPPECVDPTFKTTSYAPQIVAWREIEARGVREGLQLAIDGSVACGTTANLFAVDPKGNALVTPPTSTGCRPGITRAAVIEIAKQLDLDVREERIPLDALDRAPEAFFTSTRIECLPIARASSTPGFPITTKIRHAFRALVLAETKSRRASA